MGGQGGRDRLIRSEGTREFIAAVFQDDTGRKVDLGIMPLPCMAA